PARRRPPAENGRCSILWSCSATLAHRPVETKAACAAKSGEGWATFRRYVLVSKRSLTRLLLTLAVSLFSHENVPRQEGDGATQVASDRCRRGSTRSSRRQGRQYHSRPP